MEMFIWAFIAIVSTLLIIYFKAYWTLKYRVDTIAICEQSDLPEDVVELFENPKKLLYSFGFEKEHCQKVVMQVNGCEIVLWQYVFFHPEHYCYSTVTTTTLYKNRSGYDIAFKTVFASDEYVVTTNNYRHFIPEAYGKVRIEDIYSNDWNKVFEHHLDVQKSYTKTPLHLDAEAYEREEIEDVNRRVKYFVAHKDMVLHEDGYSAYTFRGAINAMFRVFVGERKVKRPKVTTSTQSTTPSVTRDITMYHQLKAASQSAVEKRKKRALFVGSLALFTLALGLAISWQVALILIGVLLLHEGGHILAMYLLGYKELQVLFLPFLGAVATSGQPQYSIYKSFIVLIMGPLPGIVLGVLLYMYHPAQSPQWLHELASMLLFINLFNLLPIMPLDGGQIVHQLLFFRRPLLQVFFMIFSGLFVLVLAVALGGMFWLIAALVLWIAYNSSLQALFRRAFFASKPQMPENEAHYLEQIFQFFKRSKYHNIAFTKKFAIAQHLLAYRLTRPLHVAMALLLFSIYLATLLAPPVILTIIKSVASTY